MVLQATSSGSSGGGAAITLNGKAIHMGHPSAGNHQGGGGIHIAVINLPNYKVEFAKVFDKDDSAEALENLIERRDLLRNGHIVAAASDGHDAAGNMSIKLRTWFKQMGS